MKTSMKLTLAANILQMTGMNSYTRWDGSTHCALGALDRVMDEDEGNTNYDMSVYTDDKRYDDATRALAAYLQEQVDTGQQVIPEFEYVRNHSVLIQGDEIYVARGVIAQWSNRLVNEGKAAEVIETFRKVSRYAEALGE